METLLGFDYGRRRIGIAVGQEITGTATPLGTVTARDGVPDWKRISALIEEWQPARLVIGLPRHADGSNSDMTRAARKFAQQLEARYRLPVTTMDERLSSHAAAELQRERAGSPGSDLDAIAAQIILQDWLDTNRQ